jgi:(heptosyl)LPS beta-1,4-glucosyltransferase
VSSADPIAACVVCRDEGDRLDDCLASVEWADEVLVLDLESTDDSAEVARRRGARVIPHAPVPIVELVRNELAAHAQGDWILVLDPDERVSPGLATALRALRGRDDVDGVWIPRQNVDFGHAPEAPEHRYEPQLRMYRRSRVEWPVQPNKLPVVPEERVHRVPARDDLVLVHIRNRTVAEALERVLRYAPVQAQAMIDRGETFTARDMVRTLRRKARRQFVQANALDEGVPGFVRAGVLVAFHFYVWAAFWQLSGAPKTPEDDATMRRLGKALQVARVAVRLADTPSRVRARLRRPSRRG